MFLGGFLSKNLLIWPCACVWSLEVFSWKLATACNTV